MHVNQKLRLPKRTTRLTPGKATLMLAGLAQNSDLNDAELCFEARRLFNRVDENQRRLVIVPQVIRESACWELSSGKVEPLPAPVDGEAAMARARKALAEFRP